MRYNSDGSLDTTFGVNGELPPIGTAVSSSAALAPDGSILLLGESFVGSSEGTYLYHYTADGRLDTTFGVNGTVLLHGDTDLQVSSALTVQPDGHWTEVLKLCRDLTDDYLISVETCLPRCA